MKIKLKGMSRKELEKLQKDIVVALERLKKDDLKAARQAAEKAAAAHGFSLSEIAGTIPAKRGPKPGAKKAKVAGKPKYRNPDDASQTWTGKGRQPTWFKAATEAGMNPESLAI